MPVNQQGSKGPAHRDLLVVHSKISSQGSTPCSHTHLGDKPSTYTLKYVLRTKDMITKPLHGLEVFLDVYGVFLNSSNLEMPGRTHINRPPSRESRY